MSLGSTPLPPLPPLPPPPPPPPPSAPWGAWQLLSAILGFVIAVAIVTMLAMAGGAAVMNWPNGASSAWGSGIFLVLNTVALGAAIFAWSRMRSKSIPALLKGFVIGASLVLLLSEACGGCMFGENFMR